MLSGSPGGQTAGCGVPVPAPPGPRVPSSAGTSPRRPRAPPAHPASHGLPQAGLRVCSFGCPLPHLSSMRTRCPPRIHSVKTESIRERSQRGLPRPELCRLHPSQWDLSQEGLCVSSAPGERGSRAPGMCAPWTAHLPGAPVTVCASICHPRGRASCIIQAPWRRPQPTGIDEGRLARSDVAPSDT